MLARRAADIDLEHAMLAEAATTWAATESIDRKLGEELITASREVISAYHAGGIPKTSRRFRLAMMRLEELVGRP